MTISRPQPTRGLRHVALFIQNFELCVTFYTDLLGMSVEWQPDEDNVYLTSGNDNLALHRLKSEHVFGKNQRLDHIGFILAKPEDVDQWFQFLLTHQVEMKTQPRTHRDGARSFYCYDPDGNTIQMIYHPPIAYS